MLDRHQSVASLVVEHAECAPVLQRHRIDFCCRGELCLEAAAAHRRLDLDALLAELARAVAEAGTPAADPRTLSTAQLVDQLEARHRALVADALPVVTGLTVKVRRVHGAHQPSLLELADALTAHFEGETSTVFPALSAGTTERAALTGARRPCCRASNTISPREKSDSTSGTRVGICPVAVPRRVSASAGSTRITSAPRAAKMPPAAGPMTMCVNSTTLSPANGCGLLMPPLPRNRPEDRHRG